MSHHVFTNGYEWYVASDLDDAKAVLRKYYEDHFGFEPHEIDDQCDKALNLRQVPADELLRILVDEDGDPSDDGEVVERTMLCVGCATWSRLSLHDGVLGMSNQHYIWIGKWSKKAPTKAGLWWRRVRLGGYEFSTPVLTLLGTPADADAYQGQEWSPAVIPKPPRRIRRIAKRVG